eukprot:gene8826-biopygen1837
MQRAGTHVEPMRDRVVPAEAYVGPMEVPWRFRRSPKVPRGAQGSVCEPHGGSYTAHGIASVNQVEPMEAHAGPSWGSWKPRGGHIGVHAGTTWDSCGCHGGPCRLMAVHMQPTWKHTEPMEAYVAPTAVHMQRAGTHVEPMRDRVVPAEAYVSPIGVPSQRMGSHR